MGGIGYQWSWGGSRSMHGRSGLEGGVLMGWNSVYAREVGAGGGSILGWSILAILVYAWAAGGV